jgi:hypothetical protein
MSDAPAGTGRFAWSECFGFLPIFRAFRLAIHPTKLFLAFLGVLGTYVVGRALDGMWKESCQAVVVSAGGVPATHELAEFIARGSQGASSWVDRMVASRQEVRVGVFAMLLDHGRRTANEVSRAVFAADPGGVLAGARRGLMGLLWMVSFHPGFAIVFVLLSLAVWSFCGGALCRVAALHATRDERITLREAAAFGKERYFGFLFAPLMPLAIIALFGVLLFLGGMVGAIPAIGEVLVGLLFFLALVAGFILAFVIIGAVAGFPLTYPTVAVEGSDAFDALSRTFSYVYQRPWHTALYALVSVAYGSVCLVFVKLFVRLMLWSMHGLVALSMNWGSAFGAGESTGKLDALWQAPSLTGATPFYGGFDDSIPLAHMSWFAQFLIKVWIYVVWGFVAAFAVSFFYSASTLVYLLLRREVDATDMEDVYLEDAITDETAAPPAGPAPAPQAAGTAGGTSLPILGQNG